MENKYKLTEESVVFFGITLYRIEALKDFADIKKGDKGGYVQSEANLSQEGNCWVLDDAKVYDSARVSDNALVYGNAQVYGNAKVYGEAKVFDTALVCGNAEVYDNVRVFGNAKVYGNARVCDNVKVCDHARVCGSIVYDNAQVFGNAKIYGNTQIRSSAKVENNTDYIVFKNWWSSGRYFTWTKSNNMWAVGCFYGTGKGLIAKAYKDSEISGREYKRVVNYVESILQNSK